MTDSLAYIAATNANNLTNDGKCIRGTYLLSSSLISASSFFSDLIISRSSAASSLCLTISSSCNIDSSFKSSSNCYNVTLRASNCL